MAALNLSRKECRIRTSRWPFFATKTAKTFSKFPYTFVYSERRKSNQVCKRYKHFYGLFFTFIQRKSTFLVISMSFGVIYFPLRNTYAVDFTLSFDTSFAPIEVLLDVPTSTFTAKTVFF